MKIAFIFAVLAVAANLFFIWYAKRKGLKTKSDESSNHKDGSYAYSQGYLNTPEVKQLKQSAAAELNISVEELNRLSAEKIKQLAKKKELI